MYYYDNEDRTVDSRVVKRAYVRSTYYVIFFDQTKI